MDPMHKDWEAAFIAARNMPGKTRIQRIGRAIAIFETGCSCTIDSVPEECPACVRGLLKQIVSVISEAPAAPGEPT